ncbi:MAG: glycerate kinase family protein, partial [Sciscionella sp.]
HRAPLRASSHGIGELIAAALAIGARTVVLGVGGSASTDGGAGMLAALGARILDREGRPVAAGGAALAAADSLDLSGLNPAVRHARFVMASDVDNPLLGPHGAATVYGPQKGADCHQVLALEDSLSRWSALVAATTGADRSRTSGAGAAGGVGFGALAVLDARRRSGIAAVLALVGMSRQLRNALLVITGEGSLDAQSLRGKAPIGVAQAADAAGVPSVGVAGRCSLGDAELAQTHLRAVYTLSALQPDAAKSIIQAPALLRDLGARIATDWLGDPIAVHPERMGCRSPEG